MHPDAVDFLKSVKQVYKPDIVVSLGDLIDQYFYSQFDKDPDAMSAQEEEEIAIEQLAPLYRLFPKVNVCVGNHDIRLYKKAAKAGIPLRHLPPIQKLIRSPKGWEFAERWILEDILFFHGDGLSGRTAMMTALQQYRQNVVFGHVHSVAGVTHLSNGLKQIWALATGCLVDPTAYAFAYGKNSRDKPILGVGIIEDNVPMFIPMS
jgi:metallophosphoesterase superfamily enzyme